MKKRFLKILKYIWLIGILCLPFAYSTHMKADSGWDTDYSSSGSSSSSSSGSGWSSGSSSSGSSGSSSSSSHDSDRDSSHSYRGSSSSDGDEVAICVLFLIIFAVAYILMKLFIYPASSQNKVLYEDIDEEKLKALLPEYSIEQLKDILFNKFVNIQEAWTNFDYPKLRELCSDDLYHTYQSQLEVLKMKESQNMMHHFKLVSAYLTDVSCEQDSVDVEMVLRTTFYDYIVDIHDGSVTRGSDTEKVDNQYRLQFRIAKKSEEIKCPNCGAKITAVSSTECEYCGTTIVIESSDFVLVNKNKIRQR